MSVSSYPLDSPAHLRLLELLREATGVDFTAYRSPTIVRRIEHRMRISGAPTLAAYLSLVGRDALELARLIDALLIKTTAMFRDDAVFTALRERLLPALISRRTTEGAALLSTWVVGCSTGQEAFSLGMCLSEAIERVASPMEFVIFASDIDPGALETAARGLLSVEQAATIPQALARRFLVRHDQGFRIVDKLLETILFVRHNILDPFRPSPQRSIFASFDLISCRNLLIYLKSPAQREALRRLAGACEPGGLLMLGGSESLPVSMVSRLEVLDSPNPIFGLR
ncbi:MAG: protein-glutamate O-methyltransferase CheR [Minicystis sp.]